MGKTYIAFLKPFGAFAKDYYCHKTGGYITLTLT
jgi:hypothetical protein